MHPWPVYLEVDAVVAVLEITDSKLELDTVLTNDWAALRNMRTTPSSPLSPATTDTSQAQAAPVAPRVVLWQGGTPEGRLPKERAQRAARPHRLPWRLQRPQSKLWWQQPSDCGRHWSLRCQLGRGAGLWSTTCNRNLLINIREADRRISVTFANGTVGEAKHVGGAVLETDRATIVLKDVLYIPAAAASPFSVTSATMQDTKFQFGLMSCTPTVTAETLGWPSVDSMVCVE